MNYKNIYIHEGRLFVSFVLMVHETKVIMTQMWFQIPMSVNWVSVFQFPNPTTILKHTLLLESLHTS
jgi:hypothetical protein